ncbi:FIST signal transduction protein [Sediminibacterium sp.]|uniref:FIST signal transduction protein n=1 Tax=Sediminibacterium sp. TaxID=1917865 RepID=UPI003F70874F
MKTAQLQFGSGKWIMENMAPDFPAEKTQLVLVFGSGELVTNQDLFIQIKSKFPHADIVSCSTAGEILHNEVYDDSAVVTAIYFEKASIKSVSLEINKNVNSFETGKTLMGLLKQDDLVSVLVISEGSFVNGSDLVAGFNELNTTNIPITGGLAGDAARFAKTQVGLNTIAKEGTVVAVGFYGSNLLVGHSSFGGWDEFGKERVITRSTKNILYEIDGKKALDLYKEYLGPYVDELPGSALLFPISLRTNDADKNLVRTILNVNEDDGSMIFAGNMPEGSKLRLMKVNFEKVINGSSIAATNTASMHAEHNANLAILISCVGRKLILQDRTSEEVQAAQEIFGNQTAITGFYSYGELSPFNPGSNCELHNQTMTITTFTEF